MGNLLSFFCPKMLISGPTSVPLDAKGFQITSQRVYKMLIYRDLGRKIRTAYLLDIYYNGRFTVKAPQHQFGIFTSFLSKTFTRIHRLVSPAENA